ncbi:hypothetical protein HII36_43870 [Nonomuraea sp. NN258]|uniref:hypothetical protein n=1 Tax=Nonomuraea antri TaxID=2730852 RepID=UPI001569FEC5|nr:hypothetical protein [Nonomuraea antri]NRQ38718.1 hypothetical protein [Nonomuraea antri]
MPLSSRHRLAAIALCAMLAATACSAVSGSDPEPEFPGDTAVEVYHASELRPGHCLWRIPDDLTAVVVSCDYPHAAEFSEMYVVREGEWPGKDEAVRMARHWCTPRMRIKPGKRDLVMTGVLPPLENEWPRKRTAYCLAVPRGENPMVGRVLE